MLLVVCLVLGAAVKADPTVSMRSDDLVIRDGSLITVQWTGFDATASSTLRLMIQDTTNSTRAQRWTANTAMGYSIMRVQDMAVTASAILSACTSSIRQPICAYLSPYFAILYAPSP